VREHGLSLENIEITDGALARILSGYTREAGVRNLERTIADVCRAVAVDVAKGDSAKRTITPEDLEIILGPEKHYSETAERTELPEWPPASPGPPRAATCSSSRPPACRARAASRSPGSSAT